MKPIVKRMWTCYPASVGRFTLIDKDSDLGYIGPVCVRQKAKCREDKYCRPITITIKEGHSDE